MLSCHITGTLSPPTINTNTSDAHQMWRNPTDNARGLGGKVGGGSNRKGYKVCLFLFILYYFTNIFYTPALAFARTTAWGLVLAEPTACALLSARITTLGLILAGPTTCTFVSARMTTCRHVLAEPTNLAMFPISSWVPQSLPPLHPPNTMCLCFFVFGSFLPQLDCKYNLYCK